jgi:hypothetical protein
MSVPAAWPQVLDFLGTPLVIEPSPGQLSSDAGLPPCASSTSASGPRMHLLLPSTTPATRT